MEATAGLFRVFLIHADPHFENRGFALWHIGKPLENITYLQVQEKSKETF